MSYEHPSGARCPHGECDAVLVCDEGRWVCPNGYYSQEPTDAERAYVEAVAVERGEWFGKDDA